MPSHFHFSFGIGEFFRFNFKFGSPSRTLKYEDFRHEVRDADLAKRNGIIIHEESPPQPQTQSTCPLFTNLPTEIRHIIFRMLLTTPQTIEHAHKQLGSRDTAMLDHDLSNLSQWEKNSVLDGVRWCCNGQLQESICWYIDIRIRYKAIPDIDATILRTCRAIYAEGLPILYNQNTFHFASAQAIRHFQSYGLSTFPLAFNFQISPTGRLQLIRSLILELKSDYRPFSRGGNITFMRDSIWRDWSLSLFNDDRDTFGIGTWGGSSLGFPKLEKLTLDFTEWQLADTDGLLVRAFVKRLRPKEGLLDLTLKGVKHEPTIEQFRNLLLAKEGSLNVVNA